jgi:hypothetical protein
LLSPIYYVPCYKLNSRTELQTELAVNNIHMMLIPL